nr:hypothetical telomeric SfiI fragment 1 protein 2 [Theileria parva]
MCTMIKYDNDVVWKSTDTKKFSNITTFYFGLVSNRFFVKNSYGELKRIDFKPVIKELAIPITKQTPTPKSDPNLNITPFNNVTVDIENTNGTSEFEYSKDGNCCIYSTKTGYSFGKVAQGETVIWESKDNVLGTLIRTWNDDFLAILLSNNLFKLFQHLSGNWSDITAERRDVTKLKFYGDGDNEITSVDYSVSFVKDYLYEFSFNDGVKCSKIKYKEKVVWRNMKGKMYEDIKMFQLGLLSNNFFIKNQFEYRKLTNPSIEITPVTLDIDRTYCTSQYEFSKNDNCRTYTSKYGYSINKIVKKNINIWDADPDDNALKVVLIGSGKDEKHLSILLESGDFVLLHKTRRDLFWKDITDKKSDFSDIKMYSLDDENNYNELRPLHNSIILYNTFYGYEFKKGVKCAKITNKDKLLWTHTDDPDFGYPSAIYLDLLKNKFNVINFKDQTKELKGEGPAVTLFINIDIYHHDLDHYENVSLTLDL